MTKYHVKCHAEACQNRITVSGGYQRFVTKLHAKLEELEAEAVAVDQTWYTVTEMLCGYFTTKPREAVLSFPAIVRDNRASRPITIALFHQDICLQSKLVEFPRDQAFSLSRFEDLLDRLNKYFPDPEPAPRWYNFNNYFRRAPDEERLPLLGIRAGADLAPPAAAQGAQGGDGQPAAAAKPPFPFVQADFTQYSRFGALSAWGRRAYWSNRVVLAIFLMFVISAILNALQAAHVGIFGHGSSGGTDGYGANCTNATMGYYNTTQSGALPRFPDPQDCNDLGALASYLTDMMLQFGVDTFADLNSLIMTPGYVGNATVFSDGMLEYRRCFGLPAPVNAILQQAVATPGAVTIREFIRIITGRY